MEIRCMGIGFVNIGLVNMPTISSNTFFAKLQRCDIFGRLPENEPVS